MEVFVVVGFCRRGFVLEDVVAGGCCLDPDVHIHCVALWR